ncbi:hypothetical protein PPS11_02648 [Pseudomonas putida S11]|nr:hypothetical protein PPS11_02648 [Pseudomonas putida S11]
MATTWRRAQRKSAIIQAPYIHRDLIMTLTDAIIVLLLAERIHGTDAAIRKSAKNVAQKLTRSKRSFMYEIAESKSPRDLMRHIALGLDD